MTKTKKFWRTADASGTNVSCSWRVAIAMGTVFREQGRKRRGYLVFVHWTTIQKNLKKTKVPEQMKFLTLLEQNKKATFSAEVSTPPPSPFLYEMPSNRVRNPRVRPLPRGSRKLESRLSVENPRVTVYRTYSWTYLISRRA